MKILTVHNKYKIRGGEDVSRESEDKLLRDKGHTVDELIFDNENISSMIGAAKIGITSIWNSNSYKETIRAIDMYQPDILDVHNFFPIASPAVHYAAKNRKIPVVQTLHNFRLLCLNGLFFRQGSICTDCLGNNTINGVKHSCYRDSKAASMSVSSMVQFHRLLGTWNNKVDIFVALTEFSKKIFVEGGIPEEKIMVKPNFVEDRGFIPDSGDYYVYIGRLSEEKGIRNLLKVWSSLPETFIIKIVGEGPLLPEMQSLYSSHGNIVFTGKLNAEDMNKHLGAAKALIFPSEWYETFGRVVIEAFSRGVPVIASNIGGISYLVEDNVSGFLFKPSDREDLREILLTNDKSLGRSREIRKNARKRYTDLYTPEINYRRLIEIYENARINNESES